MTVLLPIYTIQKCNDLSITSHLNPFDEELNLPFLVGSDHYTFVECVKSVWYNSSNWDVVSRAGQRHVVEYNGRLVAARELQSLLMSVLT